MTEQDVNNLSHWYNNTFIELPTEVVQLRGVEVSIDDEVVLTCRRIGQPGAFPRYFDYIISDITDIKPIHLQPCLVETGTPIGALHLSLYPARQYKKSMSDNFLARPGYAASQVTRNSIAEAALVNTLVYYTPREAAERVAEGAALLSAVAPDILVGAAPWSVRFLCFWRGELIGEFDRDKQRVPKVDTLRLNPSYKYLHDTLTPIFTEVSCNV